MEYTICIFKEMSDGRKDSFFEYLWALSFSLLMYCQIFWWILFSSQSCTHNRKCEKINLGAHCLGRFGRFRYFEHACSYNIEIDVNFPFYDLINFTNFAAKHFEM
jgi:hypothetical protein